MVLQRLQRRGTPFFAEILPRNATTRSRPSTSSAVSPDTGARRSAASTPMGITCEGTEYPSRRMDDCSRRDVQSIAAAPAITRSSMTA